MSKQQGTAPRKSTGCVEDRTLQQSRDLGHALADDEKTILTWSRERKLEEFQKVNDDIDTRILEEKLFYIDTLTVGNGEILDILRLNPVLTWEKVRDVFLGEPVEGYTSTFHGLDDIAYPEHFWKATVENEREKLTIVH